MENATPQSFIEYILSHILENTDALKVEKKIDELGTLFEVTVHESDMGRIIGKNGQTIQSLRTLLRMMGSKNGERVNLKVLEPVA